MIALFHDIFITKNVSFFGPFTQVFISLWSNTTHQYFCVTTPIQIGMKFQLSTCILFPELLRRGW